MPSAGRIAPAITWRALFAFIAAVTAEAGQAPQAPDLAQVLPDAAEAAQILKQFREAGIPGKYYLEFQLITMPRRGDTKTFQGRLWGSRNEQGAISRVEVFDEQGRKHRLLIQN